MTLFTSPEEHAANPPASWVVANVGRRSWQLRTATGIDLIMLDTKRAAENARTVGFYADLYAKETRWYAGEHVDGWKPYRPVVRKQKPPRTATKRFERTYRVNVPALHAAVEARRLERGMSVRKVAEETQVHDTTLLQMAGQKYVSMHGDTLLSLMAWLGEYDIRPYSICREQS